MGVLVFGVYHDVVNVDKAAISNLFTQEVSHHKFIKKIRVSLLSYRDLVTGVM